MTVEMWDISEEEKHCELKRSTDGEDATTSDDPEGECGGGTRRLEK